jgi:hypothetical protein
MTAMRQSLLFAASLLVCGCSSEGDDGVAACDPGALEAALSGAAEGDTVRIGACRVTASVTVPAGVTLEGEGVGESVLVGPEGEIPLTVQPAAEGTFVRNLRVESDGPAGVLLEGAGSVALEHVEIVASRGIGLGAEGLDELALTNVSLRGPVDAESASRILSPVSPEEIATHGLVIVGVGAARLDDVDSSGYAQFGALVVDSTITWAGGGAPANLGTGLMTWGGAATLTSLDLSGTFQGLQLVPAYGGVFAGGADVDTTSLRVSDSEGYGLLHSEATARHIDLTAHNNNLAALWLQRCSSFELSGAGSGLVGNGLAGIVAVDSSDVTIRHAHVDATVTRTAIVGEAGRVEVGDGVQLVGTTRNVTLEDLTLSGNARVGILVDLAGGAFDGFSMSRVSVDGADDALGAVAQGGTPEPGWDDGVTRQGATAVNDAALADELGIVGIVGPSDIPAATAVADQGLAALISR